MKTDPQTEFKKIPLAEIENLHDCLLQVLNIEVPYDASELVMAKIAITRMKVLLEQTTGQIDARWLPHSPEWPKIRDLPEDERAPFDLWLRGQTTPHLAGETVQDGYYPWDYDLWKKEISDRYSMCKDQPAQINCLVETCRYYTGEGSCSNISPAITLNPDEKFVCWSGLAEKEDEE